jgi:enterochelin esterase family protein
VTTTCALATLRHSSEVLRGNPLGDPTEREVLVLLPPGYDPTQRYPVVFWLSGFGSRGRDVLNGGVLTEPLAARLGRAMADGDMPEALIVLPDCATRLGGSQHLDSPYCGSYQTYLVDELVPFIDQALPTLGAGRRAVGGKSSGGYGAIMAAMSRPGTFDAVCAHSPDAGFEFSYLSLLPRALDTIRARGGFDEFAADPVRHVPHDSAYMVAMSLVAMAACYAPDSTTRLADHFPCDPESGLFRDDVWAQWLAHDPVRLVNGASAALGSLDLLFLDVGRRDDYAMHWGGRALSAALGKAGVDHVYEEHDGGHHGIEHRFVRSLGVLGARWRP